MHIHGEEWRQKEEEGDSCWLINNARSIQNQLGLSTQNMVCIMKSLATSLVQQQRNGRPKNPANNRPTEPSHNTKGWGVHDRGLQTLGAVLGHL